MDIRSTVRGIITVVMFTFIISSALAKDETQASKQLSAKEKVSGETSDGYAFTVETVSGEVSGIDKNYISVIYDRNYDTGTEYEILIPVDLKTSVRHKTKLADIKKGDLVSVEYEKPAPEENRQIKARSVNFIQSGVGSLVSETTEGATGESGQ